MSQLHARLQHCAGQPSLDLSHIDISVADDTKEVAKLISEGKYIDIDLSVCGITSNNLQILASSLRKNMQLQYLFLNNNRIDSHGIMTITDILRGNKNIESINLRGNQLFPAEITYNEDNEEDQSEIEELVETCCELQNLKSICGCGEFNQEIVVSASGSDSELFSDILLLGIELKLGVDLTSLQYWGAVGLSEVFEALKDNRTVLHAQFSRFQEGSIDFDPLLMNCLQSNSNLKSLQFAFEPFDPTNTIGYGKLLHKQQTGKNTLMAIWNSLENNVGVTSLQLDAWARDADTTSALAVLLRKNATLLHLSLFGTALLVEDLVRLAHSLEYNNTLRVLSLNRAAYIATDETASRMSPNHLTQSNASRSSARGSKVFKMKSPPAGTNLLTMPEVRARFEAAYKARKIPFTIRTEEEDLVFGPAQLLPLPAALQWEVGDTVQVKVDPEEYAQYHQQHQNQQQHERGGKGEEGEGWVDGTVWAVHADQRYTVKINATGQVRFSLRASMLRAGDSFHRLTELNRIEPLPVTSNHHHFNPSQDNSRGTSPALGAEHTTASTTTNVTTTAGATLDASATDITANASAPQQLLYPVVYPPGTLVEARYLGDAAWLPATIVSADQPVLPTVVTVQVTLPLESVLEVLISIKGSKNKELNKLDSAESKSVMVYVQDTVEMETCFVRPVVPDSLTSQQISGQNELVYAPARANVLSALGSKLYYDAGAYMRGDYVEVRLFSDHAPTTSTAHVTPTSRFEWKRGRVSLDRKNGTFDVRMETGLDLTGIRGCHLRHHFRPKDVVDCRLPVSLPAFLNTPGDAQPVLPELYKSVESAANDMTESSVIETATTHHLLHRTPLTTSQLHLVPLPAASTWVPALVLKQERSGLFSVSLQDGSIASVTDTGTSVGSSAGANKKSSTMKGVTSARLMPANRAHVRKGCEDMRVIAQSWPVFAQQDPAHISQNEVVDAAVTNSNKERTESSNLPSPGRPVSVELSAAAGPNVTTGSRLESVQEESSQLSTQSQHNLHGETTAGDSENARTQREDELEVAVKEAGQNALSVDTRSEAATSAALSPVRPVPVHPSHPSHSSTTTNILTVPAVATTARALISPYDINDRVEVCHTTTDSHSNTNNYNGSHHDSHTAIPGTWLAGRIEGIHADNCTYIVRFVDGTVNPAVPLKQMRRASAATPVRAGARVVDKKAITITNTIMDKDKDSSSDVAGAEKKADESTSAASVPAASVHSKGGEGFGQLTSGATAEGDRGASSPLTHPTPVRPLPTEEAVPTAIAENALHTLLLPHTTYTNNNNKNSSISEFYRPDNHLVEASDTPWVGKQLFPPFRSPEPALPTPSTPYSQPVNALHAEIRVGAWLSIYNATLECFEPCVVDRVFPAEGQFDATNRRGEVYRRIDPRYIEPHTSALNGELYGGLNSELKSALSSVVQTPASQLRFPPSPSPFPVSAQVNGLGQGPANANANSLFPTHPSNHSLQYFNSLNMTNSALAYKIGAAVEVCADNVSWVRGVVVKKLAPHIYNVYVEHTGEECTVVASQIRSVSLEPVPLDQAVHQAQSQVYPYITHPFTTASANANANMHSVSSEFGYMDITEGSLDGSLDDDELVVVGTSLINTDTTNNNTGYLSGSHANSAVGSEKGSYQQYREHYGEPVGVSVAEPGQAQEPEQGQGHYERRPHTAPHATQPHPPRQNKNSSNNNNRAGMLNSPFFSFARQLSPSPLLFPERSSSANRQDKYNTHHPNSHHHHPSQPLYTNNNNVTSDSTLPAASSASHIFPLTNSTLQEDPQFLPLLQKPVTISARLSSHDSTGDLSTQPNAHSDPSYQTYHYGEQAEQDRESEQEKEYSIECGVCYRSHASPLTAVPFIAYLHASGRGVGKNKTDITEHTVITVVPYSDHAVFGDCLDKVGYSFVYHSHTSKDAHNNNCILLSMHVAKSAPEVVPVKVSFYVNTIIISEVCFNVTISTTNPPKSRSGVKPHGRMVSTPLTLRTMNNNNASATIKKDGEAQSVWRRAVAGVFHEIAVLTVDLPMQTAHGDAVNSKSGSSNRDSDRERLRRRAAEACQKIMTEEVVASAALLPSCVRVIHHPLSGDSEAAVLAETLQGAHRVQLFVLDSFDGENSAQERRHKALLTRESWLSLLRAYPVLDHFVKDAISEYRSNGNASDHIDAGSTAFFLNRLIICTPITHTVLEKGDYRHTGSSAYEEDVTPRDWLFSVGLSPFNLEQLMPYHGHSFLQTLWTFAPSTALTTMSRGQNSVSGFELTLKVRFVSSQRAVQRLLTQLIKDITLAGEGTSVPQGLLLLPGLLAKFGFQSTHTRLPIEQFIVALQQALEALFATREAPQHNEDTSSSSSSAYSEADEARSGLQLYTVCDTLGSVEGVALQLMTPAGAVNATQAFTMAPLLKAVSALAITHCVSTQLGIPLSNGTSGSGRGVYDVATALRVEELLLLHEFYSLIEYGYLHWKYAANQATDEAASSIPTVSTRTLSVLSSADQILECAVTHLENALLGLQQHDISQTIRVFQDLAFTPTNTAQADVHVVRAGEDVRWMQSAEYKKNWRCLAEISHPHDAEAVTVDSRCPSCVVEEHVVDVTLVEADSLEETHQACELSPYRAMTAASASPLRPQSSHYRHNHHNTFDSFGMDSTPEAKLTCFLSEQVGIKDAFSAQEATSCLIAMGCTSCEDFVSMGSLFSFKKGQVDGDKLRGFLNEGGIPLFIAAKLAAFVVNKTAHF